MIFNKNKIFTIWIKNKPTILNYICWNSIIKLGYHLTIYYDTLEIFDEMPPKLKSQIQLSSLSLLPSFYNIDTDNLLQKIDVLRFILLKKNGGTWIDSDMFLLKRLPHDDIIISSERTLQSGGRKSKELYRANIGVLRFPPNNKFIEAVIEKLFKKTKSDLTDTTNSVSKMMKFIKLLKLKKWEHMSQYIAPPHHYCPIDFVFAKEIYKTNFLEKSLNKNHDENEDKEILGLKPFSKKGFDEEILGSKPFSKKGLGLLKYGLKYNDDFSDSYAIHLWENLALNKHHINLDEVLGTDKKSLFYRLCEVDKSPPYKIEIPSAIKTF